jgi:hypothetical protein
MAPRQKDKDAPIPAYKRGRETKVILPLDVVARIEARAREEGTPLSRVIVEDLRRVPQLEGEVQLHKLVQTMERVLTHYGSRIVVADLTDQLIRAVDHLLAAQPGNPHLDGLRVLRTAMLGHERQARERPNLSEAAPLGAPGHDTGQGER